MVVGSAAAQERQQPGRRAQDPDQAVDIAREAATIAVDTRSVRMRRELSALERAMRPWQDTAAGDDLVEALAPVSEGGRHG